MQPAPAMPRSAVRPVREDQAETSKSPRLPAHAAPQGRVTSLLRKWETIQLFSSLALPVGRNVFALHLRVSGSSTNAPSKLVFVRRSNAALRKPTISQMLPPHLGPRRTAM